MTDESVADVIDAMDRKTQQQAGKLMREVVMKYGARKAADLFLGMAFAVLHEDHLTDAQVREIKEME